MFSRTACFVAASVLAATSGNVGSLQNSGSHPARDRDGWLGRQDSNPRMAECIQGQVPARMRCGTSSVGIGREQSKPSSGSASSGDNGSLGQ
jgi:hypothetical protein